MVHSPSLSAQLHINPGTPIAPLTLGNFPDPCPQSRIVLAPTAIPQCVPIQGQYAAHPTLTEPKALGHPLSGRSLRLGRYQFFAVTAFSACMSSTCSATICFNRRFSSSSWRSFFTSRTSSPAYLVRHL